MADINVVVGVIVDVHSHRLLLQQRRPEDSFPYDWESPGGKVNEGETDLVALRRELDEEIKFPSRLVHVATQIHQLDLPGVQLRFYLLRVAELFVPQTQASVGFGWFTINEMGALTLTPGNRSVHKKLSEIWR